MKKIVFFCNFLHFEFLSLENRKFHKSAVICSGFMKKYGGVDVAVIYSRFMKKL